MFEKTDDINRTHKLLIVDDEKFVLAVIMGMLRLAGRYTLISAPDGQTAIQLAETEQPDLVLMDWQMPVLTGFEALQILKANPATKEIPVIITTGLTGSEKLQEALDAGASDYIRKPVDKTELLARVKSALLLYDSFREIKRQKEQIQSQVQELEKLSLIAKETDNSVLLVNAQGEIEWVNEGFNRMYGCDLDGFHLKYGKRIFAANEELDIDKIISDLHQHKQSATYETVIESEVGEFKWVQTRLTPIFDDNDNIKKFIAIETDITKLKEAESELKEHNEKLQRFSENLQEINTEIRHEKEIIEKEKQAIEKEKLIVENEKRVVEIEKQKTEKVLLNILPENVAFQLKSSGAAQPRHYKTTTVMFTDFKGFTMSCEDLTPEQLVKALHTYFVRFDDIIEPHYIEKIKTIGDAYMCVGGLPLRNRSNPFDVVLAGLEIQDFMRHLQKEKAERDRLKAEAKGETTEKKGEFVLPIWQLRLGIHTGEVVAGVVGKKKFAYDIWGDTVNIASRMESSGEVGKVNISGVTYELIKDYFDCVHRGKIDAKNKGKIDMYFVEGIKPEFARDVNRIYPNDKFIEMLNTI